MLDKNDTTHIPNILIVDDNPNNIFAIRSLLEHMPVTLHEANSGNQALELLLQHEFALVLLDVQMPGIDGFETAELMRKNKRTKEIPIIFVTALSKEEQYIRKGLQIGAVDYLLKPLDPIILQSKVAVFINYHLQKKNMEQMISQLNDSKKMLTSSNKDLTMLAKTDMLTGLQNRLNFEEMLEHAIQYAKQNSTSFALLYLDLDHFKYVNDTFGHDCGDLLLQELAVRLKKEIRSHDVLYSTETVERCGSVSRLGGDEFAIILTDITDPTMAGSVADRIIRLLKQPFLIQGNTATIGVSIGIAYFPADGDTKVQLAKNADIAMYYAKEHGKNCFQYYSDIAK